MSGEKFQFELLTVHLGVDEDGDPITSCIIKEGEPITEQTQSLTGAAKIALDILKRAIIDAGEDPLSSPHIPPGVRAINTDLWREYCYSGTVTESDDAEAKRKAFGRPSKRLQELKKIGTWNGWVWPV